MGYAAYVLPDGTEAGYAVEATCDASGCDALVWRGVDALCGERPGENEPDHFGCGRWYCAEHQREAAHNCEFPACGVWSADEIESCYLVEGHDGPHQNMDGTNFTA